MSEIPTKEDQMPIAPGLHKKNDSLVRFNELSDDASACSEGGSSTAERVESGNPTSLRSVYSGSSSRSLSGSRGTYYAQNKLPRLPIPSLEDTLHKFSSVVMPALLTEEERKQMNRSIAEFLNGDGPKLQQALIDYEKEGIESGDIGSYVEEFWNESYLAPDASVVLNLNPFFVLEEGPDPKINKDQLRSAARLTFSAIKFASALKNEALDPDLVRGKPICMDQFRVLFGASRQPSLGQSDDVHVYGDSTHFVVLCNNQFYYVPVLWPDSYAVAVDEGDLVEILRAIERNAMEIEPSQASKEALGVFTSLPRSEWAKVREEMTKDSEANLKALKVIDSALFVLVLDNFVPENVHEMAANMLHGTNKLAEGDTAQVGTCLNRWYDKLQIIVCKDGTAGINFEHSSIDGHTALRFVSDIFAETVIAFAESIVDLIHGRGRIQHVVEAAIERAATTSHEPNRPLLDVFPKKLVFELSESVKERIYFAETALCDELGASDTWVLEFNDYGKLLIVANKMSPDSFVQMSILLAYYKLYGKIVCAYEPVMTKMFYHGRTEAMRSATIQAKEFCRIWCSGKATKAQKLEALRVAAAEHSRLVKESAAGKGVDRHLFSLKCIAERVGMRTPAFFESFAWKTLNHTVISTSNCGNPCLRLFGFGPVVSDGFGVGYIIKDHQLSYSVSSKHRQTQRFVRSLGTALKEMQDVLLSTSTIQVQKHRTTLIDAKETIMRQVSDVLEYPDVYGERSAPLPPSAADSNLPEAAAKNPSTKTESKAFVKVVERHDSFFDLFSKGPKVHVEIDLQDGETFLQKAV